MARPWRQTWCDLAFLHWSVPVETVRPLVPEPLEVRQRDGVTWVAVVPFRMEGIGWRWLPGVPGLSEFPEINVRVYVEFEGKPGVWFLSLEANRRIAVAVARRRFFLPYHFSRISFDVGATPPHPVSVASRRVTRGLKLELSTSYRPTSGVSFAAAGSLEEWLTDLTRLYSVGPDGRLYFAEVDHGPWPLQEAAVQIEQNDLLRPFGFDVAPQPQHSLFSRHLPVRMGRLVPVESHRLVLP